MMMEGIKGKKGRMKGYLWYGECMVMEVMKGDESGKGGKERGVCYGEW